MRRLSAGFLLAAATGCGRTPLLGQAAGNHGGAQSDAGQADSRGVPSDAPSDAIVAPPTEVPRPLRPWNGEDTGSVWFEGSLRPRFQWEGTAGATTHEIQIDDSCPPTAFSDCTMPSPEIAVTVSGDASFRPGSPLSVSTVPPVGRRYFWRLRACNAGGCGPWSPIRYVDVGRQRQDLNGDGYADIIAIARPTIGTSANRTTTLRGEIFAGWPTIPTAPTGSFTVGDRLSFDQSGGGGTLAYVGDLDADGFGDVAAAAPDNDYHRGLVHIYRGGATFDASPALVFNGTDADQQFGVAVGAAGDIDGDGHSDFAIVTGEMGNRRPSQMFIYLGADSLDGAADRSFSLGAVQDYPVVPLSAGDLDGDGLSDLVVGGFRDPDRAGHVLIFLGRSGSAAPLMIAGGAGTMLGKAAIVPGDLNGDGYADLAIASGQEVYSPKAPSQIEIRFGARTMSSDFDVALPAAERDSYWFANVLDAGDIDGDGFADLVARDSTIRDGARTGLFHVFRGGLPLDTAAAVVAGGAATPAFEGSANMAVVGDVNGDGFDDLATGDWEDTVDGEHRGAVFLYFGGAPLDGIRDLVLPGGDPGDYLGVAIAR